MQKGDDLYARIVVFGSAALVFGILIFAIFEPTVRSAKGPLIALVCVLMLSAIGVRNRLINGRFFPGLGSGETIHQMLVKRSGFYPIILLYIVAAGGVAYGLIWLLSLFF